MDLLKNAGVRRLFVARPISINISEAAKLSQGANETVRICFRALYQCAVDVEYDQAHRGDWVHRRRFRAPLGFRSRQRVRVRIATQKCIQVFNTTEIGTDGDVLHCALMFARFFGLIPRALILDPRYPLFWSRQIDIHVRPMESCDK